MICLTIKIASTLVLPGRKPYWLSLENVSICSLTLFKIILQNTFPEIKFNVMALFFSATSLSPFLWVGMSSIFNQSPGVRSFNHSLLIILCNICSIAGSAFFITSAVILSYPARLMSSSTSTSRSPGCSSSSARS